MSRSLRLVGSLLVALPIAASACSGSAGTELPVNRAAGCHEGTKWCAGKCVDALDPLYGCDPQSCSPCVAPEASLLACRNGACVIEGCRASFADCDARADNGCEADLLDPSSCGTCGTVCGSTELCSIRGCGACEGAEVACNRRCVDVSSDPRNCGRCGNACGTGVHGSATCRNGGCVLTCDEGFGDCDGDPTNGCEPLVPYYVDADGDGWGAGAPVGAACAAPKGFSTRTGDCADGDPRAHPGQTEFFPSGYVVTGATAGATSWDFDCNGEEELGPGCVVGSCKAGSTCVVGHAPVGGARGAGTSPICGSIEKLTCPPTLACVTTATAACTCR